VSEFGKWVCGRARDLHGRSPMFCEFLARVATAVGRAPPPAAIRSVAALGGLLVAGVAAWPSGASAEPLRLRADAVAQTQSPAGLIVMQGSDRARPWLDVEALVWAATAHDPADVLVLAAKLRDPEGRGELKLGRFVVSTGAIRPVQVDGASGIVRTPWGTTAEAFAGSAVVPRFAERPFEWVAGGRLAQSIVRSGTSTGSMSGSPTGGASASAGLSYMQRRSRGEVANEEVGADVAAVPVGWLDLAARGAYALASPGLAEALGSAAVRSGHWRLELFASYRSPSRILPATSLFSVLGDFPSETAGGTLRWGAAPRLDLLASGAAQRVGGELGGNGWVRALLRLDDDGAGSVGLELRRQQVSTARWTGIRALSVLPLGGGFRYSTELELVVPDSSSAPGVSGVTGVTGVATGSGAAGVLAAPDRAGRAAEVVDSRFAWPWGLMALSWRSAKGWEVAGAIEASSRPAQRYEAIGLARVSRSLELGP
jgi:hypothetical protein